MWVPLVENNELDNPATDYFIKKHLDNLFAQDAAIDTLVLACTHYPLLINKIREFAGPSVQIISQGELVAGSLSDYLRRHSEVELLCSKNASQTFFTTECCSDFDKKATHFLGRPLQSKQLVF
jgi:glutamate racemase